MIGIQMHLIAGLALMTSSSTAALANGGAACLPFTWTTLGTAGGPVPPPDRGQPSNLLRVGDRYIIVDSGDGTVNQLSRLGMNLGMVDSVFLSHHHLDHIAGLAAVVGLRWMNDLPGRLTVYGPPGTRELVDGLIASMQLQARIGFGIGRAPAPPKGSVQVVEMADGQRLERGLLKITARANTHFRDEQAIGAPGALSLSYRFDFGDRSITYSGDTAPSQALARLASGSDLLVTEIIDFAALA